MIEISWKISDIVRNTILRIGEVNGSRISGNLRSYKILRRILRHRNVGFTSKRVYRQIELSSNVEWQVQPDSVREVQVEMLKNNLRDKVITTEIPQITWGGKIKI